MPKVTEDYLTARRQHIIDSARRVFARNGFHATSMQDLFAESGMSAGAFYRYFDSKGAIIVAIARESMTEVVDVLASIAEDTRSQSMGDALAGAMELLARKDDAEDVARLALQAWSEAVRDEAFAVQLREVLDAARATLTRAVRRLQREGSLPSTASAEGLMSLFISILPGFLVQRAVLGPASVAKAADAARALWPPPSS